MLKFLRFGLSNSAIRTQRMNLRLLWTTTALLTAALAMPSVSHALERQSIKISSNKQSKAEVAPSRSQLGTQADYMAIARVQPHQLAGRMAATLYVRNVPVLTFVGSTQVAADSDRAGADGADDEFQRLNAPIKRAQAVAASINQMYLDKVDASDIRAVWEPSSDRTSSKSKTATKTFSKSDRYLIKVKDTVLVELNSQTRLPDTFSDRPKDALQATNRLRQLIGNAPPLKEISGRQLLLPKDRLLEEISVDLVESTISGLASWYSFSENGSATASGESFSDNELTAAHLTLPLGTKVRVTNRLNGRSVVVRINDRGPYIQGRIIDLSPAAAGLLGMIEHGVVPVDVDVLSQQTPAQHRVAVGVKSNKGKD